MVILDTATRRGLVDSAYNERRSQCETAAAYFHVRALRDVTVAMFEAEDGQLDATTRRRARHVISEDDRTVRAVEAMRRGDIATLGRLMNESHASLRDDYEVSSDALNAMVEAAQAHKACFGARMTGAGFGGCAVAIVRADAADDFVAATSSAYQAEPATSRPFMSARDTAPPWCKSLPLRPLGEGQGVRAFQGVYPCHGIQAIPSGSFSSAVGLVENTRTPPHNGGRTAGRSRSNCGRFSAACYLGHSNRPI